MSSHGSILLFNDNDGPEDGIHLRAYSDGGAEDAIGLITNLPFWLIDRALTAQRLGDHTLGPAWWLRQLRVYGEAHWHQHISVNLGAEKSLLASYICASCVGRWQPVIGDIVDPAVVVRCYDSTFTVGIDGKRVKRVKWLERLRDTAFSAAGLSLLQDPFEIKIIDEAMSLEAKLSVYGMAYHKQCEDYDRTVCTGKSRNGVAMPGSSIELGLVNSNAKSVLKTLTGQLLASGLVAPADVDAKLHEAIQGTQRTFEKEMAKKVYNPA